MKPLSESHINGARYPNTLAKHGNPSDNYNQILSRLKDSIRDINDILTKILPYSIKYSERYDSARKIEEQFTMENLSPIFHGLFPLEVDTHGKKTEFFDSKFFNADRIKLATFLLQFLGKYLLQAFPNGRHTYLHSRIDNLVQELDVMIADFSNTRNLEKRITEYSEYLRGPEPEPLHKRKGMLPIECLGCRELGYGDTNIDAIKRINHKQKCKYLQDNGNEMLKYHKWFRGALEI